MDRQIAYPGQKYLFFSLSSTLNCQPNLIKANKRTFDQKRR